jgi:hypothetical protein
MMTFINLQFPSKTGRFPTLPSCCRVVVLLSPRGTVQVGFLELDENQGLSITNSWPHLAMQFMTLLPMLDIGQVEWFEVYAERLPGGLENVSRVYITADTRRFEFVQDSVLRRRLWSAFEIEN